MLPNSLKSSGYNKETIYFCEKTTFSCYSCLHEVTAQAALSNYSSEIRWCICQETRGDFWNSLFVSRKLCCGRQKGYVGCDSKLKCRLSASIVRWTRRSNEAERQDEAEQGLNMHLPVIYFARFSRYAVFYMISYTAQIFLAIYRPSVNYNVGHWQAKAHFSHDLECQSQIVPKAITLQLPRPLLTLVRKFTGAHT